MPQTFQREIGGRNLILETGKLAGQANASVLMRYGDTLVLVTICRGEVRPGADFLPLTVDYEERLYAAGKIPGSFFRREGRPSQEATLAARLTDRPLRPLFPKGFYHEVQLIATILSADQENDPDLLSIIGSSAALTLSDIPFSGPVGAVRLGYREGEWLINPTFSQLQDSLLDLVVTSTRQAIVMLEAGARELPEELILEGVKRGKEINQEIIQLQEEMAQRLGRPKMEWNPPTRNPEVEAAVAAFLKEKLPSQWEGKSREEVLVPLKAQLLESLKQFPREELLAAFETKAREGVRRVILNGKRLDGRRWDEIRSISMEAGVLPRTHGSGLFTRGQTQVLTIATLGSPEEEQRLDTISPEESKRFLHHYNFPPFSTGETKRVGSPSRREIGHGALVERALAQVLPSVKEFPYTIRLVSEVLSSNGSTSMASVCASSLALMDAGVPLRAPVAGVAMGLVGENAREYAILTDIAGAEDAYGDMDFKVAGTTQGLTALQLDIKLSGVSLEMVQQALLQAQKARQVILGKMKEVLPTPRSQVSPYAPKMYKITIDPEKIGYVIGFGGKTIKAIMEETKATIDIENDGTIIVGSHSDEGAKRAIQMIEALTRKVEVGQFYTGKVTRLLPLGVTVEIFPGKEGLIPLRELASHSVGRAEEVAKLGDELMVKVIEVDRQGRITLSRRAVFEGLGQTARVGEDGRPQRPYSPPPRRPPPFRREPPRPSE